METVEQIQISDVKYFGIIKAKDWFEGMFTVNGFINGIYKDYYVVVTWADYHDGQKSNIEGKMTIGIFRDYSDAEYFYKYKVDVYHQIHGKHEPEMEDKITLPKIDSKKVNKKRIGLL